MKFLLGLAIGAVFIGGAVAMYCFILFWGWWKKS